MSFTVAERILLIRPARVMHHARLAYEAGIVSRPLEPWQVCLGVLRMWHRVLFRTDTIGTCDDRPVRSTWRAKLLSYRAFRLPALLAERAVAPLDFTGLLSRPERIIRHLLGAHHDGEQFVFDLQLLSMHPGRLDALVEQAAAVVNDDGARARWLRDLTVFESYHEELLRASARAAQSGVDMTDESRANPDISLSAYLEWCADQPATAAETVSLWRRGEYHFGDGRVGTHPQTSPAAVSSE